MLQKKHFFFGGGTFIGFLLVIAGILLLLGIPLDNIINDKVLERDYLGYTEKNGTVVFNDMTKSWILPPYKFQLNIWMFNVTNVEGVLTRHEKPNVQEIGPFVYEEAQKKVNYRFILNNTRVVYKNKKMYFFNRTASCPQCDQNLKVTIPNVVFQKLVDAAEISFFGIRIRFAIESILKVIKEGPFITVPVHEALFDGYEDPTVDLVCKNKVLSFLCSTGTITKRIGFFYQKNGSTNGVFEVDTGNPSPMNIGKMYSWNNMKSMPDDIWNSSYARMINGTDGQLFAPLMKREDRLTLFVPDICRSIHMKYVKDVAVAGIPSWRYSPPADAYDPALEENRAFCNKNGMPRYFENSSVQIDNCLPAGFIDLSQCQPGAPRIYLSQPHFANSPVEVWNAVTGLRLPSSSNDDTYVDMEPVAGVAVRAKSVMQINVGMVNGSLSVTENMKNVIVPVLWMNETAYFDQDTKEQLEQVGSIKHTAFISGVVSLSLGLVGWLAVFVLIVISTREQNDEYGRLILNDDEEQEQEVPTSLAPSNIEVPEPTYGNE